MAGERNISLREIKHLTATGQISAFAVTPTKFSKSILRWHAMRHRRVTAYPRRIFINMRNIISV